MRKRIEPLTESTSRIELTQNQWAIIDNADIPLLQSYSWSARFHHGNWIVRGLVGGYVVPMSHLLLPPPPGQLVDHVNRNSLDNRRTNLRLADRFQNARNRGNSGIRFHKGKWEARISADLKQYSARFESQKDAIEWRDKMAKHLFGEFAPCG
jgi:hypothetical protein